MFYSNIENPVIGKMVEETFRRNNIMLNSTLRTSESADIIVSAA